MSHYLGFVFVDEPTEAAAAKAMDAHQGEEWDWYRCGGRWDGFLLGEQEMERRRTHDGFNFDDSNKSASRNCCRVSDLPSDKMPYFFVSGYDWIPKKYYNAYEKSEGRDGYGRYLDTPYFEDRWREALEENREKFVVVVDAHN